MSSMSSSLTARALSHRLLAFILEALGNRKSQTKHFRFFSFAYMERYVQIHYTLICVALGSEMFSSAQRNLALKHDEHNAWQNATGTIESLCASNFTLFYYISIMLL